MTSRPRPGLDPPPDSLPGTASKAIEPRVVRAAEAALADRGYVSAIDILVGLEWHGSAGVPAAGRRRAQPACEGGQRAVRGRRPLEQLTEALRAAGDPG